MSTEIPVRELRNSVSAVLRRAEAGEEFVVTVQGRPVARVSGIEMRPSTMPTPVVFAALRRVSADPGLLDDLSHVLTETTDDIHWPA